VAGFSCVDFSGLNNKKKTLEAGGESGDTFKGIRDYAERWRPKIIILENVSGAPWDRIRDQAMVAIGYRAEYLKVDTKDYYLPHTRVRGYMICVDARAYHDPNGVNHIPKSPQLITSILKTWVDTMKSFKRPASCSIEAFLLDEDDPRLSRAREELSERDNTRSRVIDWACCHGRHQDYRMALSLGSKRPITKWLEGGFCEPLDFMWIDFIRTQPERVQDMIDISFLRNLDRGFDHHFKT
jgi:site-specific DNA-cytosine methylase